MAIAVCARGQRAARFARPIHGKRTVRADDHAVDGKAASVLRIRRHGMHMVDHIDLAAVGRAQDVAVAGAGDRIAVAAQDAGIVRLFKPCKRRVGCRIADGIMFADIIVGAVEQIVHAVFLEDNRPLVPDHRTALQFPFLLRRGDEHRLADDAREVLLHLDAVGLACALTADGIGGIVLGIVHIDAAVVVKEEAAVNHAVVRREERRGRQRLEIAVRRVADRNVDGVQIVVPLRREDHIILSVIGVHLGRPALLPRPAERRKREDCLALGRPCVQVLGLPHGKARSARAVEIICIIGVQDKRVCRLVGQVVLVVIARQIQAVFDLDKPVARLRIACVRRICRRLCAAPCRQKYCGKQNRCPRPSEKSHIVLRKFC